MAFGKEQIKNIALDLLRDLLANGGSGSKHGGRPGPPPGRADRPYYKIECWMGNVDLTLRLQKIVLVNSIMSVYPVFFLDFLIDAKDYPVEKIYGQDTMTLHITLTSEDLTPSEDTQFELLIIDIKMPMNTKSGDNQPSSPTENPVKMIALVKQPFNMMTTPVNIIIEPKAAGTGSQKNTSGKFGSKTSTPGGFLNSIGESLTGMFGSLFKSNKSLFTNFFSSSEEIIALNESNSSLNSDTVTVLNSVQGKDPEIVTMVSNLYDYSAAFSDDFQMVANTRSDIETQISIVDSHTTNLTSGQIDVAGKPANLFNTMEKIRATNDTTEPLISEFTEHTALLVDTVSEFKALTSDTITAMANSEDDFSDVSGVMDSIYSTLSDAETTVNNLDIKSRKLSYSFDEFSKVSKDIQLKSSDISYNIDDSQLARPPVDLEYRKQLEAQQMLLDNVTNSLGYDAITRFSSPQLISEISKINTTNQQGSNSQEVLGYFSSNVGGGGGGFGGLSSNNLTFGDILSGNGGSSLFGAGTSGNNPFASGMKNSNAGTASKSERTPFDYAKYVVNKFIKDGNFSLDGNNKNSDKLEQITIPPRTFCGAIRYLNNMYSIFKGPMFSFCRWEDNTYCLWDLSKAIEKPEDYTVEFLALGQNAGDIQQKAQGNDSLFFTYNPIHIINRGNKNIAANSYSQVFIKKDLHEFVKIIETNASDLSKDAAADSDKSLTYNDTFKNRKRVYSRGITGGVKQTDNDQLKNKIVNYLSSASRVWFELNGYNIPITRLSRIGGSIKLNPHVPEYIPYAGKYVVSGSVIQIARDQNMGFKANVLVYCFRENVES